MPAALAFFAAHGWEFSEISYDMTQHLGRYRTPPAIYPRLEAQHVTIASATEAQAPDVLAFVDREFPTWSRDYHTVMRLGDYADCLLACDQQGHILGSLIMYTPQSHEQRLDVPWQALFGNDLGGLGTVGVAEAARNRGIGSALVARGSELSRARGVGVCLIGWTWAVDFYSRLGYAVWQSYAMSWRRLD
jgi:predicted N-acetyltransferase YhbS